ncbi:MAG: STAS domain-containing protein [Lachnospiraceae bacterium]|nr:STAS domain-containing protein [Lachnospiraceae bacterium]
MDKNLLERVNPIYKVEQEYLKHLASTDVQYAGQLYEKLGFDSVTGNPQSPTFSGGSDSTEKAVRIADEARYLMTCNMIRGYEFKNIVEIPCGYTPRGMIMAGEGYKYIGLDLPAVIDDMAPVTRVLCETNAHRVSYESMDATNFGSITHALENVNGQIAVVSEIMLSYLTDPELISVCDNIYKLLASRGGCWITMDIGCKDLYKNACYAMDGNYKAYDEMTAHFRDVSNIELYGNSLYDNGLEGAEKFLTFRGFDIEKVSVSEVYPELGSISNIPRMSEKLKDAFRDMEYWTLTVARKHGTRVINTETKGCRIDKKTGPGFLYMSIAGRIDTITAPDLLKVYEESAEQGQLEKITIDCKELEYISSAGLRVILIMLKALKDPNGMLLKNVSDQVMDILETTGFSDIIGNITHA